jgi:hypothetical protein
MSERMNQSDKEWYEQLIKGEALDVEQAALVDTYAAIKTALANELTFIERLNSDLLKDRLERGIPIPLDRAAELTKRRAALAGADDLLESIIYARDHPIHRLIDGARKSAGNRRPPSRTTGQVRSVLAAFVRVACMKMPATSKTRAAEIASGTLSDLGLTKLTAKAILSYENREEFGIYGADAFRRDIESFSATPPEGLIEELQGRLVHVYGGKSVEALVTSALSIAQKGGGSA